jgi:hypothetical protein
MGRGLRGHGHLLIPSLSPAWGSSSVRMRPTLTRSPTSPRIRKREIIVGQERAFAAAKGLNYHTVRNFLAGHRPLLAKRWKLLSSPLLLDDESEIERLAA